MVVKHHILKTLSFPSMLIKLCQYSTWLPKSNVAHLLKLLVCDLKENIAQVKELLFFAFNEVTSCESLRIQ